MRGKLEQTGLSYVVSFDNRIHFVVNHIRQSKDGVVAEVRAYADIAGIDPDIHWAKVKLTDSLSRRHFITSCRERIEPSKYDWLGMIEFVCREVVFAERQQQPFRLLTNEVLPMTDEWIIKDFAYRNEPTTLFADGGSGKSRFALATLLSIQTGKEIIPGLVPMIKGTGGYIDWEANENRLLARADALCNGAGIPRPDIHYLNAIEPLYDCVEDVAAYCKKHNIVYLVIDSVEMAIAGTKDIGGDANDSTVKLYAALRTIGVSSLLIDHVSKGELGNSGSRLQYGSIFKRNLARMQFELRMEPDDFKDCFHLFLKHTKRNDDGKLCEEKSYRVDYDDASTVYTEEDISGTMVSMLSGPDAILEILKNSEVPLGPKHIASISGKSIASIKMGLRRLLEAGKINKDREKYSISKDNTEVT